MPEKQMSYEMPIASVTKAIKALRRNLKQIYSIRMSTKRSFNPLGINVSSLSCQ